MRRTTAAVVSLFLLAGLTAACSSDDEGLSDEEQEYADAFAEDMTEDEDGFGVTDDESACMAESVMAELGVEPFEEADVEPADLRGDETPGQLLGEGAVSDDQADTIAEEWEDCADLPASLAASLASEGDLDDDATQCIEEGMAEGDIVHDFVTGSFTSAEEPSPEDPAFGAILDLLTECTTDEDGSGGVLVDSIAESLAAGGAIPPDQAQCVAQSVVDAVGEETILQQGDEPSPEAQAALQQALLDAGQECGVDPAVLGG
jgi:hypothetical protein